MHPSILPSLNAVLRRAAALAIFLVGCTQGSMSSGSEATMDRLDGPTDQGVTVSREEGDANLGREVFRSETFGNEGFWTNAVRLPQGIAAAKVTPLQALSLGIQVDIDAIDPATRDQLAAQLRADPSGRSSAILNDPNVTMALVKANAVIGMPPKGDRVGASCALCHTVTDGSGFSMPNGGSIGKRIDGLANHNLDMGKIFATAANSRALYPVLQLSLRANKGKSLGRAPSGLTENSSEAEVDAYLSNPAFYPVGMFDDTFDGNGNPMHNTPLFRQDLAAPYGSEGVMTKIDDFSNLVFTTLFDQTMLTTPGARAFLRKLAGPAGEELADNYVKVLASTGVTGYPFVQASPHPTPGELAAPIGVRVDNNKLIAMNAYLSRLQAPKGASVDREVAMRGRETFRTAGCTTCHNVNQGRPVPTTIHAMARIFPGDNPVVLAQRMPPLNPVMNTENSFFDDKMAVVNASVRGEKRGTSMPLLLDLARKPVFLHDDSVRGLAELLNPSRGPSVPHPFYISDSRRRADVVDYLRSLDTDSR